MGIPDGRFLFAAVVAVASLALGPTASAGDLDVTIYEYGGDGQAADCSLMAVSGLKKGGDGFLAVRSGPGTQYRKIDEIYNGDYVIAYDNSGKWVGVLYGHGESVLNDKQTGCGFVGEGQKRPLPYKGKKGWVHSNWLKLVAG